VKHLAAVDEWLAELERDFGPIPPETLEWAAQITDQWESERAEQATSRRRAS